MASLTVASAQLNIRFEDKDANREACASMIISAAEQGADLVVFPEMTLTGFSMRVSVTGENAQNSETVRFFCELARRHRVHIIFGVVFLARGKGKNMAIVVDSYGKVIAQYQKIHLFGPAKEDRYFEAGVSPVFFTIKNVLCSLVICYDLRFPGLFEAIGVQASHVIFVIANWPAQRIAHWKMLLQARALDCAATVVGVNRIGAGGGQTYTGHSSVYGPSGDRLMTMRRTALLKTYTIDCNAVTNYRIRFPSLRDKRYAVYAPLLV